MEVINNKYTGSNPLKHKSNSLNNKNIYIIDNFGKNKGSIVMSCCGLCLG